VVSVIDVSITAMSHGGSVVVLLLLLLSALLLLWLLQALLLHWAYHFATVPLVFDVGASFVVVLLPMSTECLTK
jgi:hypothetical protein